MSTINTNRRGCKDVFHAFLVKNATYDSDLEIPKLNPNYQRPVDLIPFSKALHSTNTNAWVHFYEDDVAIERIWNNPNKYLPVLKKFSGVITPDFSVYRDMPLIMQYWNIYRSRAIGCWLQNNEQSVAPNIRYGDGRTYRASCAGVAKHSTIALGTHGCLKVLSDRYYFIEGLEYIVRVLEPKTIIVYGSAPEKIFLPYKNREIEILQFDSDFSKSRKAVK